METIEEWDIEHEWKCGNHPCNTINPFRNDKCSGCGQPKNESHEEIVPKDMSRENRVTDTDRYQSGEPDWFCGYCSGHSRNPAGATKCMECGADKGEKKSEAQSHGDTTAGGMTLKARLDANRGPSRVEKVLDKNGLQIFEYHLTDEEREGLTLKNDVKLPDPPQVPETFVSNDGADTVSKKGNLTTKIHKYSDEERKALTVENEVRLPRPYEPLSILRMILVGLGFACLLVCLYFGLNWLFGWHPTVATVSSTAWSYQVNVWNREIHHGRGWRNAEPRFAFNETCHTEVAGHRPCNPYSCRPHSQSYSCNCTTIRTCHPVTNCSTTCTSNRNGSSRCRRSCSTYSSCSSRNSCSTCSRTVFDTCYNSCPIYGQMCEYDYPLWVNRNSLRTTGTDHTPIRPNLHSLNNVVCLTELESLHIANNSINECARDSIVYSVGITSPHGSITLAPDSKSVYDNYTLHSQWNARWDRSGRFELLNRR